MLDRRQFVCTLMSLIALGSGRRTAPAAASASLEGPLSREVFLDLLKEPFSLWLDNRAADVFLLRVDDDDTETSTDQFTVVFEGPRQLVLRDGMYRISHATAGTTDVFLQPAGHDDRHTYGKAPFNLLRERRGIPSASPERAHGRNRLR